MVSEEEPTHNNSSRGARVSYRQRERGRAGRGGTTCTNLQLSSPVPLTGVCQPADAAGGGTALMPKRGGGQPRGGLSRERSRMGADPPWGGQGARGSNFTRRASRYLNDERDRNETEAQTLKLYVFIVHSLLHMDRSINVMDLVGGSFDLRRVSHLPQAFCLRNKPPRLRQQQQRRAWRLVTPQPQPNSRTPP